jgi:hypothetical protein
MKVTETPPDNERLALLSAVTNDAAELLGIDLEADSP